MGGWLLWGLVALLSYVLNSYTPVYQPAICVLCSKRCHSPSKLGNDGTAELHKDVGLINLGLWTTMGVLAALARDGHKERLDHKSS